MKSLENVLFGCTFWSVFSSPDRGYRPVRFTLSTNLTAHIVGTVVLGVPTTSPALQNGVRMGQGPFGPHPAANSVGLLNLQRPYYGHSRRPMAEHAPKPPPEPTGPTWGHSGPLNRSVGPKITRFWGRLLNENWPPSGVKSELVA